MPQETDRQKTRSPRFSASIHAELHVGGQDYACNVTNLSRTGVLLTGDLPQLSEPVVVCTVTAPGGKLELRAECRVARILEDSASEGSRVALAFEELDPARTEILEALINRLLEANSLVPLDELDSRATPSEIRTALDKIPVPHRIAAATRATPRQREFLRHDRNPQVLEGLARNANLLAREIRELAVNRSLVASTIEAIARDPRWKGDADLKVKLASHPSTPVVLADALLSEMRPEAMRAALQTPGLNDMLRAKLLRKLSGPGGRR